MKLTMCMAFGGLAAVLLVGCDDAEFVFVMDGRPACEVVATGDETVDADIAFFTNAVARMTGAEVGVRQSGAAAGEVGNTVVFDVRKADLIDEDDYEVSFPDRRTMKVTGSDQSCRWVMNRLLEGWGAVFCFPCEGGTHWPRTNRLSVAYVPFSGTKSFKLTRDLYAEDPEWERSLSCKHRAGENFFNHNVYKILPVEKYGKEPWLDEIMPEVKGKRSKPAKPHAAWQPCYASEKCVEEAVGNICSFLDKHPGHKTFSLSVNDLEGYCECAGCKAMNGGSFEKRSRFGKHMSHSESYYRWVDKVVKGVRTRHPGVYFGLLAYCGTIDPPSFPLDDHVVPFLCCETYQVMDEKTFANREELIAAWSGKAKAIGFWDYAYGCRYYQVPRVYTAMQAKMFGQKARFPFMHAFFMEGSSFVGEGPKRYLYAKLIAEPDCDVRAELDRWYRACCGEAAAADLKAYYDLWEEFYTSEAVRSSRWYSGVGNTYLSFGTSRDYLFSLSRAKLDESTRLMSRVKAAAEAHGDADQRLRAERLEEFHRLYVARAVAGGCGLCRPDSTFADARQAAAFVEALPEMDAAHVEANRLANIIATRRRREPRTDARIAGHCDSMINTAKSNTNRAWLFNAMLEYVEDPVVRKAMAKVAADSRAAAELRQTLASLASLEEMPNDAYPRGQNTVEDFELWKIADNGVKPVDLGRAANGSPKTALLNEKGGWPAAVKIIPELRPDIDYLFRVRLENTSKSKVRVRMLFSLASPGGNYPSTGEGTEKIVELNPGDSKTASLFAHSSIIRRYKKAINPAARLYIILNGLPKGEQVVFDSLELKPLCGKR